MRLRCQTVKPSNGQTVLGLRAKGSALGAMSYEEKCVPTALFLQATSHTLQAKNHAPPTASPLESRYDHRNP